MGRHHPDCDGFRTAHLSEPQRVVLYAGVGWRPACRCGLAETYLVMARDEAVRRTPCALPAQVPCDGRCADWV